MSNDEVLNELIAKHEAEGSSPVPSTEGASGEDELELMKREAPLLDRIQRDTGETGRASGNCIYFRECPVCGHRECLRYYPANNSWYCFGASGNCGGSYVDYVMRVDGLDLPGAVSALREATGRPPRRRAESPRASEDIPFDRYGNGAPKDTIANAVLAMEHDPELRGRIRMNAFTGRIEFARPLPWSKRGETGLEDSSIALPQLTVHITRKHRFEVQGDKMRQAVTAFAANRAFDPVLEMFESLPPWDGARRVDGLLETFLRAEPTPYTRAVSRLIMCGIIERQFDPGAKFDYMPVLMGHQGCGKSTFCQMLALDRRFFCENMQSMDCANADALNMMNGKTIAEIGELNALKRAKTAEAAKAFISATHDEYRGKYQREAKKHPRRFILIGTTNEREFLTDATGNRRYLPVLCGAEEPTDYIGTEAGREYMAQAYAEALAERRKHGDLKSQLVLPRELQGEAARMQEGARVASPYQAQVAEWVRGRRKGERVNAAQVASEALGIEPSSGQYKNALPEIRKLLDAMPDAVRRMEGKQRVDGYATAQAWEVV